MGVGGSWGRDLSSIQSNLSILWAPSWLDKPANESWFEHEMIKDFFWQCQLDNNPIRLFYCQQSVSYQERRQNVGRVVASKGTWYAPEYDKKIYIVCSFSENLLKMLYELAYKNIHIKYCGRKKFSFHNFLWCCYWRCTTVFETQSGKKCAQPHFASIYFCQHWPFQHVIVLDLACTVVPDRFQCIFPFTVIFHRLYQSSFPVRVLTFQTAVERSKILLAHLSSDLFPNFWKVTWGRFGCDGTWRAGWWLEAGASSPIYM